MSNIDAVKKNEKCNSTLQFNKHINTKVQQISIEIRTVEARLSETTETGPVLDKRKVRITESTIC